MIQFMCRKQNKQESENADQKAPESNALHSETVARNEAAGKNNDSPFQQANPRQAPAMKFRYGNGDQPLSGFTIKRGVGIGGFGEVYFATNTAGKEVAIKQIQRNLEVEVRGVRQCMNLKHPNLIALYDIQFDAQEQGWIVMEYVAGASLRDVIEQHPQGLPHEELMRWFGQIAAGVAYLHDHGIVHRDLKPANIFEDEGIVKIGDYGLSKYISCSRRGGQTESVGTFHYMAPEIGKGEYGKEIDVYALGVMLYELATGNVPFDGESSQEIIMKHLTADPDLSLVNSPIREVVAQALAKNPTHRFSSVRDMVRPLGMEVDDHYLLVRTKGEAVPPVLQPGATSPAPGRPVARRRPAATRPGAARVVENARAGKQAGPNRAGMPLEPIEEEMASVQYNEPIARSLRDGWMGLNRWWRGLEMNPNVKTVLLVLAIVFFAFNASFVLPFLVMAAMFYVPWYCLWWIVKGSTIDKRQNPGQQRAQANAPRAASPGQAQPVRHQPQPQPQPQPRPRPVAANRPLSLKQWRLARRQQLAQASTKSFLSEITGSWFNSSIVIAVFGVLATLMTAQGNGQGWLVAMTWTAVVSLIIAWTSIGLGKLWQKEEGDWAVRSFTQLTFGLAVGFIAFLLADYLMLPWQSVTMEDGGVASFPSNGFWSSSEGPLLPAYLVFFTLLMGAVRWWKQVDPLRNSRFSFWAVIWSVVVASAICLFLPFPQPWGALIAAGTSIGIQLASPWINPTERLNVMQKPEMV